MSEVKSHMDRVAEHRDEVEIIKAAFTRGGNLKRLGRVLKHILRS